MKYVAAFFAAFAAAVLSRTANAGFSKYVDCTVGYSGNAVANFPVLVKIDGTKIPGFYSEVKNLGADLKFTDSIGSDEYPYEVDTWNASGTSLVWVKLPSFANGTTFRMYYGDAEKTSNGTVRDVWTGYLAVVHLNGVNGLNDSAAGYTGIRIGDDDTGAFEATGPIGGGYINSDAAIDVQGGGILLQGSEGANVKAGCTISMWMKHKSNQTCNANREKLVYKRAECFTAAQGQFAYTVRAAANPWDVLYYASKSDYQCWGANMGNGMDLATDSWKYITTTVDISTGAWVQYCNGVKKNGDVDSAKTAIADNDYPIAIGNASTKNDTIQDSGYYAWKGSFDEVRVYDGVLSADWVAADYAVATTDVVSFGEPQEPKDDLIGDFSADITSGTTPTVTFTANVVGGAGEKSYFWDFCGTGVFVSSGNVATATYTYAEAGLYSVVMKVTAGSETIFVTNQNYIASYAPLYVDSSAAAGGTGSQSDPLNNLAEAFAKLEYASAIYLKGEFTLPTEGVTFEKDGFVFAKWGDASDSKPILSRNDYAQAPSAGIFQISGANVVMSDISFRYPREIHYGGPLISANENGAIFRRCDFELSTAPEKVSYNGVIKGGDNKDWTVDGCSFKGYGVVGNVAYRVLCVCGGVTVKNSYFEGCSSVLAQQSNSNPWDSSGVNFISNIVCNSKATETSGANAGAVAVCDSWKFCNGLTIAHNVLVNTDASAGCVATIRGGSNPYQNAPLMICNNTIVGYDAVVEVDNLTCVSTKSYFTIFNNLCNGEIPLYVDAQTEWRLKENVAFIRNNVQTGGAVYTVPNYTLTDHATVTENQTVSSFRFRSTDPASPDFYRPKTTDKRDVLVVGGWTDEGKYPAYLGAIEPSVATGMMLYLR